VRVFGGRGSGIVPRRRLGANGRSVRHDFATHDAIPDSDRASGPATRRPRRGARRDERRRTAVPYRLHGPVRLEHEGAGNAWNREIKHEVNEEGDEPRCPEHYAYNTAMPARVSVFATCLVLWFLLSGHFGVADLVMAVFASAVVTALNRDLEQLSEVFRHGWRLLAYVPWILREIWLANLQVVKLVLDPQLPIDPVLVRVPARFSSDLARTVFANSITLTPGTITIEAGPDEFLVHALTRTAADDLVAGAMARRVGRVFGESGA
jgi:multicomponent Na+:H+ antiporter subunit E